MTDAVRLEWMPDSPVEWKSDGVLVTASEVRDVLTSSHIHCTWEVSRRGELNPCGKTAVAIRYDENNADDANRAVTASARPTCFVHRDRMPGVLTVDNLLSSGDFPDRAVSRAMFVVELTPTGSRVSASRPATPEGNKE